MRSHLAEFRARALARAEVRSEYDALAEEFQLLNAILEARAEAGLTQAQLAERIGTTQSAVARLESSLGKHSPSLATLRRYASALGYRIQIRLVKEPEAPSGASKSRARVARRIASPQPGDIKERFRLDE